MSHNVKWFLSAAFGGVLLSFPAAAQLALPGSVTLLAPLASQQREAADCGPRGEPPQQNKIQPAPPSEWSRKAIVKRAWVDQKEIYLAPFHRHNLKWDALFLAATGGLIAADKHVTRSDSSG